MTVRSWPPASVKVSLPSIPVSAPFLGMAGPAGAASTRVRAHCWNWYRPVRPCSAKARAPATSVGAPMIGASIPNVSCRRAFMTAMISIRYAAASSSMVLQSGRVAHPRYRLPLGHLTATRAGDLTPPPTRATLHVRSSGPRRTDPGIIGHAGTTSDLGAGQGPSKAGGLPRTLDGRYLASRVVPVELGNQARQRNRERILTHAPRALWTTGGRAGKSGGWGP